jgi:hypothetical protein
VLAHKGIGKPEKDGESGDEPAKKFRRKSSVSSLIRDSPRPDRKVAIVVVMKLVEIVV